VWLIGFLAVFVIVALTFVFMVRGPQFWEWARQPRTIDGLKTWLIAILIQAGLPLLAFLPEYARTSHLSAKTIGAGSTLYILGLGLACKDKLAFGLGLGAGVCAAVLFGADPALVDDKVAASSFASSLAFVLIGIVALLFAIDRFVAHVLQFEAFGPFAQRSKNP
jgi:hypothetical protein